MVSERNEVKMSESCLEFVWNCLNLIFRNIIMMDGYDETKDYKKMHLEWIKANPRFRPLGGVSPNYPNYYSEIEDLYRLTIKTNKSRYLFLRDDYMHNKTSKSINAEVAEMFGDVPENNNPTYFVTFNWSDDNFKVDKILNALQKLFSKSWIDNAVGVFEYYGLNGNHPHFHSLIQVNKHKTFGRFRDKIFQSALGATLCKNFIDIKVARNYHTEYLEFDKRQEKTECMEKDKLFRREKGLNDIYQKPK